MSRALFFAVGLALVLVVGCADSSPDEGVANDEGLTLEVVDGEIVIPQSAIAVLARGHRFTSDLDISTEEGDLTAYFEGAFQALDRIEGTMQVSGGPFSELGEFEVIIIDGYAWWNFDDEWQDVVQDRDMVHPLVMFSNYATPRFYLEALRFDSLTFPVSGPAEIVNGVEAIPVQLDRQSIIGVMQQGTEFRTYPEASAEYTQVGPGFGRNLEQLLPENFVVEVWFARRGGFPIRILVSYDITEADSSALSFGLGRRLSLHLQMDITDTNANVKIEPPIPIPTEVPTPTTPPGELTGNQRGRIAEIAATDPRVQEIIAGGSISIAHETWRTSDLDVLGGYTYVNFNEPRSYEGSLPSIVYDESETTDPPFTEIETDVRLDGIERLLVLVYLREERVVQIEVVEADAGQ